MPCGFDTSGAFSIRPLQDYRVVSHVVPVVDGVRKSATLVRV
jgi:hypothetical protein